MTAPAHVPLPRRSSGAATAATIGVVGALSIGLGGMIDGGFFATIGIAIDGARSSTYFSFLVGGVIALLTAYSYVRLSLRYPGPGGTVTFVRLAFGPGLIADSLNVLLVLSYIAVMAVYARALSSYALSYLPPPDREFAGHFLGTAAIVGLGLLNFAGARLASRCEAAFDVGKIAALTVFIFGGFTLGTPAWNRLGPADWVPVTSVVASGIVVFLSYEGFELIANASDRVRDPERTLPIAFYGSLAITIGIYMLVVVVCVAHMPFAEMERARDFALSATAQKFLGTFGFALMTVGAILASASAINADFFGAEQLPVMLARQGALPRWFDRHLWGRAVVSLVTIGGIAVLAVNVLDLHSLSAITSGGFVIVFAAVNFANAKLADATSSRRWISLLAGALCLIALVIMLVHFFATPKTRHSATALVSVVAAAVLIEVLVRRFSSRASEADGSRLAPPGAA